jgi:hypothetical protein
VLEALDRRQERRAQQTDHGMERQELPDLWWWHRRIAVVQAEPEKQHGYCRRQDATPRSFASTDTRQRSVSRRLPCT